MATRDEITDVILEGAFYRNPQFVRKIVANVAMGNFHPTNATKNEAAAHLADAQRAADAVLALLSKAEVA